MERRQLSWQRGSITKGIAALAHGIEDLLTLLGWREPKAGTQSG
jgi:hypothetical protein